MEARLIHSQWLKRVIEVNDGGRLTTLVYSGRGVGSEKVVVDGIETSNRSQMLWFVPRFEAANGDDRYVFEVRVWPWLALRSLQIEKNGVQIYAEGNAPYRVSELSELVQLAGFAGLIVGPVFLWLLSLR